MWSKVRVKEKRLRALGMDGAGVGVRPPAFSAHLTPPPSPIQCLPPASPFSYPMPTSSLPLLLPNACLLPPPSPAQCLPAASPFSYPMPACCLPLLLPNACLPAASSPLTQWCTIAAPPSCMPTFMQHTVIFACPVGAPPVAQCIRSRAVGSGPNLCPPPLYKAAVSPKTSTSSLPSTTGRYV